MNQFGTPSTSASSITSKPKRCRARRSRASRSRGRSARRRASSRRVYSRSTRLPIPLTLELGLDPERAEVGVRRGRGRGRSQSLNQRAARTAARGPVSASAGSEPGRCRAPAAGRRRPTRSLVEATMRPSRRATSGRWCAARRYRRVNKPVRCSGSDARGRGRARRRPAGSCTSPAPRPRPRPPISSGRVSPTSIRAEVDRGRSRSLHPPRDPARADGVGEPVGDDRGEDHERGDVEDQACRWRPTESSTSSANSIEATPLGRTRR